MRAPESDNDSSRLIRTSGCPSRNHSLFKGAVPIV